MNIGREYYRGAVRARRQASYGLLRRPISDTRSWGRVYWGWHSLISSRRELNASIAEGAGGGSKLLLGALKATGLAAGKRPRSFVFVVRGPNLTLVSRFAGGHKVIPDVRFPIVVAKKGGIMSCV